MEDPTYELRADLDAQRARAEKAEAELAQLRTLNAALVPGALNQISWQDGYDAMKARAEAAEKRAAALEELALILSASVPAWVLARLPKRLSTLLAPTVTP